MLLLFAEVEGTRSNRQRIYFVRRIFDSQNNLFIEKQSAGKENIDKR